MATMRVGVIGVGNMGGAMAARLLECGWPVTVRDLVPEREAALQAQGAAVAPSPAALAERSDAVIVVVFDAGEVREVLFGAEGVCTAAAARRPGAVMLCPTIAPQDTEACAARLAQHGIACIDAPMSGGPARTRSGQMSLMVACDDDVFERHRGLLDTLAANVFRIGPRPGDGARTKLVNNLIAAINLAGTAEALALAQRIGLDPARTLDVIEKSSGASWIGSDRMRRALAGDYAPRAHTTQLAKDSRLALEMGRAGGFADMPLAAPVVELFRRACEAGGATFDDAWLYEYLKRR